MGLSGISFTAIDGHDRPITILKRALANRTLAHAYLFSGEEGIGKKMTALALAAAVNCQDAGPEGGCGSCPSCRKISSGGHPDMRFLAPDGTEIKIDQVRQVQADLALKPSEGTKKVLIIDGVESMKQASSNAFLKTLEEPPGDALLILITALPHSLLPTIRSRCQEIRFHPLPRRMLAQALMKKRGLSERDAWFLAALAQGRMGRGLEMDVDQEKTVRKEILHLWSRLTSMDPSDLLAQADMLSKDRERFDRLLDIGIEWLRDILVFRTCREERFLVNTQAGDVRQSWGGSFSFPRILADLDVLFASRIMLERRVSAQLVAENLLLKLGKG